MIKLKNAHFNPPIQFKSGEILTVNMHFHSKNIMNFKYDGKIYTGTRQEIIESLKDDLKHCLIFRFSIDEKRFSLGEEEYILFRHTNCNVNGIKTEMIQAALNKVPENFFIYDGSTYYGSKEKILKNIEKDLRNSFFLLCGDFCTGEERCGQRDHSFNLNLITLHENMIAQALRKIKNDI